MTQKLKAFRKWQCRAAPRVSQVDEGNVWLAPAHNRICVLKVSDTFAFTWIRFRQVDSVVGTRINFSGDVHAIPAVDVEQFVWKNAAKIRRWSVVLVCV